VSDVGVCTGHHWAAHLRRPLRRKDKERRKEKGGIMKKGKEIEKNKMNSYRRETALQGAL